MRAPKSNASGHQKQKVLSIHIDTDHVGPHGMPMVYGSTNDYVGKIKGTVKFSSNYDCRGRDIVILYEAKAEAQWTALENKKIVNHHTEEIFGHHKWHFPLTHTKPNGSMVAAGVYEKEFEVLLVHPSLLNQSLTPSTAVSDPSTHTLAPSTNTLPAGPALLLPSSSYSPHAKMKYTIRAILQRPFPCITDFEASQEIWVLHSSLPPLPPPQPMSPGSPPAASTHKKRGRRTKSSTSATTSTSNTPADSGLSESATPSPSASSSAATTTSEHQESHLPRSLLALTIPTKVIKSALSMLPTLDLSSSKPSPPTPPPEKDSHSLPPVERSEHVQEQQRAPETKRISVASSASNASSDKSNSSLPSSTSTATASRPFSDKTRRDSIISDNSLTLDDEKSVDYTGVWEPFQIPYLCSLPSETVYLGQVVPLTIRFGPRRNYCRKSSRSRDVRGSKNRKNGQLVKDEQEHSIPSTRLVVKKGILKVVEHTLLREVTVVPAPPRFHGTTLSRNHGLSITPSTTNHTPRPSQDKGFEYQSKLQLFKQQQQQSQTGNVSKGSLLLLGLVKKQSQDTIYQEKSYNGSHSHLYNLLHNEQQQSLQRTDDPLERRRSLFNLKRRSLDVTSGHKSAASEASPRGFHTAPITITGVDGAKTPSAPPQNLPPPPPMLPVLNNNTRIVNSIEAKFKTEVMILSLTPLLQQRERKYQQRLYSKHRLEREDHEVSDNENDEENEEEDERDAEEDDDSDYEEDVWQTTVWIHLPGPSELATSTETKHIVKKHTLQLILLCGLAANTSNRSVTTTEDLSPRPSQGSGTKSLSSSVITMPGINKEFRLENTTSIFSPGSPYHGYGGTAGSFSHEMEGFENEENGLPDPERDLPFVTDRTTSPLEDMKKNFTIVTAASSNHFCALESFLYSMSEVLEGLERTEIRPTLVVYNLGGMTDEQLTQLQYLKDNQFIDEYKDFDYAAYPSFWDINIARGEYGWKAGIIKEVADKYRGLVLWLDSGNMLALDFLRYLPGYLDKFGFWSPQSSGSFKQYTHEGLPQYYQDTIESYAQETNCNGAAIAFDASNDKIYNGLLAEWYKCSSTKDCIAPQGSSRTNHRQDQAALTYLVKRMHFVHQCQHFPEHYGVTVHQDKVCRERIRAYKILRGLDQETEAIDDEEEEEEE
ncbi:hypothetical protein BGZ51_004788 [Haplosporangium sp. Z 767]|nr:hypothetical protein BGZ51_004788 [Haplosporangium sp. Z 767]